MWCRWKGWNAWKYFFGIFDVEENHKLEKSMEKIFFMNTIMSWRETKKKGHGYKMSNLLKKFKVWNWKKFFVIVNRQKIVFFLLHMHRSEYLWCHFWFCPNISDKNIKRSKVIRGGWGGWPINNKVGHVFRQKAAVALMVICSWNTLRASCCIVCWMSKGVGPILRNLW